jgi:hypothetical protein
MVWVSVEDLVYALSFLFKDLQVGGEQSWLDRPIRLPAQYMSGYIPKNYNQRT